MTSRISSTRETWTAPCERRLALVRFFGLALAVLMFLIFGDSTPGRLRAQEDRKKTTEYLIKGAYLYQFTKFVEWPKSAFARKDSPIVIGILGADPFGKPLDDAIKNRKAHGRVIVVQRYRRVEDLKPCHILFISGSEASRLSRILVKLKGTWTLAISDIERFAHNGGAVRFYMSGKKVLFEINIKTVKAANLKISSKVLKLAKIVKSPLKRDE